MAHISKKMHLNLNFLGHLQWFEDETDTNCYEQEVFPAIPNTKEELKDRIVLLMLAIQVWLPSLPANKVVVAPLAN